MKAFDQTEDELKINARLCKFCSVNRRDFGNRNRRQNLSEVNPRGVISEAHGNSLGGEDALASIIASRFLLPSAGYGVSFRTTQLLPTKFI